MSDKPVMISTDCICGAEKCVPLETVTPEFVAESTCAQCGRKLDELWTAALRDVGILPQDASEEAKVPSESLTPPKNASPMDPESEKARLKQDGQTMKGIFKTLVEMSANSGLHPESLALAVFNVTPLGIAIHFYEHGEISKSGMGRLQRIAMLLATVMQQILGATPDAFSRNAARQAVGQILAGVMMPENVTPPRER